ncbi:MAG TPA: hydrogenase maturation protease [Gaiellaceae bacterium]|nr:hydrogenase maturation protease [Gaiellaceae bacterium]
MIGVGNRFRRDDAAGLEAAAHLRGTLPEEVELLEREGEPTSLIDAWRDADAVWLLDAVSSGAPPGTLHRLDAAAGVLPPELFRTSTHHLGLAEAVELARAVGALPPRLVVFGIEAERLEVGEGLSPAVAAAAERAAAAVREEVLSCTSAR